MKGKKEKPIKCAVKLLAASFAAALLSMAAHAANTDKATSCESFGDWGGELRAGSWITGDLPKFEKAYAAQIAKDPGDYKARILHAATLLMQAGESKTVQQYAKKFGFTLDYFGLEVRGSAAKPSAWPKPNDLADRFVKEFVPVLKSALGDLRAIPSGWKGTVELSADEFPLDETVFVDIADVLFARAGLEVVIGMALFAQGYDLTVDYAKAKAAANYRSTVSAGKFLDEQPKFMAKVRNQSSLSQSRSWMAMAFGSVLAADAAVRGRTDDRMHFIEYEYLSSGIIDMALGLTETGQEWIEMARASLSAAQEVDVGIDIPFLPNDGVLQVYLGALFDGKITRDLLPTLQKDAVGWPVPVMETVKDPTFAGLLPGFTTRTWTEVLKDFDCEVAHQTVTVKLDANGGKTAVKSVSFDYDEAQEGCFYPELPVPTKAGGIFAGWATAKAGGVIVRKGDFYDLGDFAGAKAPTLYAQWLPTYALTVKGEEASATWAWSGEQHKSLPQEVFEREYDNKVNDKGVVNVPAGAIVSVNAAPSAEDKRKNKLVFQKWTVSSSKANLGAGFQVGKCGTTLVMPPEKLTLTATYIDEPTCGRLWTWADAGDSVAINPPYDAFEWSPDGGKTWYKSGATALLKAGAYTVSWRSTDAHWSAPALKEKVTVEAGRSVSLSSPSFVFSYVPEVVVDVMTFEGGNCLLSPIGGSATMNPKDGLVPVGKSMTLKAKASKGYAFQGWAFAKGWQYGNEFDETAATWKMDGHYPATSGLSRYIDPVDFKVHVVAVFKAIPACIMDDIVFNGLLGCTHAEAQHDDADNASVDIYGAVGCEVGWDDGIWIDCAPGGGPLTFKLAGKLPAGLKFDAKKGRFSGIPTKAADTTVSVVATDPAKNSKKLTVNIHVKALPEWVVGEFRAMSRRVSSDVPNGLLEMSVTAAGKVSAKYTTRGGTVSFSGNTTWVPDENDVEADGQFHFSKEGKNGWAYVGFGLDGSVSGEFGMDFKNGNEVDHVEGEVFGLRQDKALLAQSSFLDKYYTFALGNKTKGTMSSGYGYLTVKTDRKGGAKVTGMLPDGQKLSLSGLLLPQACCGAPSSNTISAVLCLFASPSAYSKKGWFASALAFSPDGTVVADPEMSAWLPGGESEDGNDEVTFTGTGALYSEAKSLEDHYWKIVCNYSKDVTADYVNKVSDELEAPMAAKPLGGGGSTFFDVFLMGTAKGEITLAAKSLAPWNDGKMWHFDVDKNGKDITDPSQLSFSFAKATGIFSGKAAVYFDYDDQNTGKKVLKTAALPFNGVVITKKDRKGFGAAVYSGKSYEKDKNTGKWKEIKTTVSLPVTLQETE